MPTLYNPPPTYADPTIEQGGRTIFNPIWLKWFVDLAAQLGGFDEGNDVVFGASTDTSVPTATTTTVMTIEAGPPEIYLLSTTVPGTGAIATYSAWGVLAMDGLGGAYNNIHAGAGITITLVGLDVRVNQTSGSTKIVHTQITKIG